MPRSNYREPSITFDDVCEILKSIKEMPVFDCSLSGQSGKGFVCSSVIRVIEKSNYVLWVVVTKDGNLAYQVKTRKWLSTYYELIEDADQFYVVWNDKNRIIKYYLVEMTD
ncbi:MAG: hypothetical protein ABRQ26_12225 [Syntrophomonadaceae bacterium]